MKHRPGTIYLARKIGKKPNAGVLTVSSKVIELQWEDPDGWHVEGQIDTKLARLLADRILRCLKG
jgi:hypothetical protein